jgi:large subunit ribosomal protein L7A
MSYEKVKKASNKIIGTKQTVKALKSGQVVEVIVALDADDKIKNRVIDVAKEMNVPIVTVDSMKELGKACGIDVGAATVAITR